VLIFGVVLFALGILVSVSLHELGHMLTAKAFGMKVRRYFVGFGPTIFSFNRGGTEYGLKAIPLGGFCDIAGMTALDEVTPEEAPRAMWRFKTWKRTVVLSAGSITHFIIGFVVLYLMAVSMGLPNVAAASTPTEPVIGKISCVRPATTTEQVNADCAPTDPVPARTAGLLPGDKVTAVAGKPTPTWDEVLVAIKGAAGPTAVEVQRGGQTVPLTIDVQKVPRLQTDGSVKDVGMIGASPQAPPGFLHYGPLDAIGATGAFTGQLFADTAQRLVEFPSRIPAVVSAIFGGERDPNTPVSVVGASRIGGEAVERGLWELFLYMLASLNFFVGVFNLLPLLPLDGGHIAVAWYERVRDKLRKLRGKVAGGPVDYTKLSSITMIFVFIGGAVTLLTVTADIVNPIRLP
jgi:membrane-associated protease RseP (regulator of RpoE activity)